MSQKQKKYAANFDNTEALYMPNAIGRFMLAQNFPIDKPYLQFMGNGIFGELFQEIDFRNTEDTYDELNKFEESIQKKVSKQLTELENEQKQKLFKFVIPRLECLIDLESMCPDDCGGPNRGRWFNMLKLMLEELRGSNMNLFAKNVWLLYGCDWLSLDEFEKMFYPIVYDKEIKE